MQRQENGGVVAIEMLPMSEEAGQRGADDVAAEGEGASQHQPAGAREASSGASGLI